jgi:hypothetical protein
MARANTHPRSRQARRQADSKHDQVSREYEGGHAAPYSPQTPEVAEPDAPAVEEVTGRDQQDGMTDARRRQRSRKGQRKGRSHLRVERTVH